MYRALVNTNYEMRDANAAVYTVKPSPKFAKAVVNVVSLTNAN